MFRVLFSTLVALMVGISGTDSPAAENVTLTLTNTTAYQVDYYFTFRGEPTATCCVINPGAVVSVVVPQASLLHVRWTGYTEWQVQTWQVPVLSVPDIGLFWSMVVGTDGKIGVEGS